MQQYMFEDLSKYPLLLGGGGGRGGEGEQEREPWFNNILKVKIYDAVLPCSLTRNRVCQLFQSNPLTIFGKVITII